MFWPMMQMQHLLVRIVNSKMDFLYSNRRVTAYLHLYDVFCHLLHHHLVDFLSSIDLNWNHRHPIAIRHVDLPIFYLLVMLVHHLLLPPLVLVPNFLRELQVLQLWMPCDHVPIASTFFLSLQLRTFHEAVSWLVRRQRSACANVSYLQLIFVFLVQPVCDAYDENHVLF